MICFWMEKTYTAKTPLGDFKVTTSENPLLSKQAITSKGIPIPYTNLQLNFYPNIQLDLFCNDNLSFSMHGSTWLTNCVDHSTRLQSPTKEGCWLQSSSVHPDDEDQEDTWLQNPAVHKHSNFFTRDKLGKILSPVTICMNKLCSTLIQLVLPLMALKIIHLYV